MYGRSITKLSGMACVETSVLITSRNLRSITLVTANSFFRVASVSRLYWVTRWGSEWRVEPTRMVISFEAV